jgi:predicted acyltransferase
LALSGVLVASALAGIFAEMVQAAFGSRQHFLCAGSYRFCYWLSMTTTPNKSPEPTAVGACSSAVAVPAASRRWLSFFR